MRGSIERRFRRLWAGEGGRLGSAFRGLTAPLEVLYAAEVARRNRTWDRRLPHQVGGLTVVSVGNLTVGGTGKTPLAAWAAATLAEAGARPALLSWGYGMDEPALHRRWNPGVPVVPDSDRVRGAQRARAAGADTVVLDDGFQHRRLARDLDVVLLAAEDRFPGRLLPRGPYREPVSALGRAHHLVVTRRTAPPEAAKRLASGISQRFQGVPVSRVWLAPAGWSRMDGKAVDAPSGNVLAVAGIARPEVFAQALEAGWGLGVDLLAFRDHHVYDARDAEVIRTRARTRTVVTTEKDAVKLQALSDRLPGDVRVLTQRLLWEQGGESLRHSLIALVERVAR